MKENAAFRTNNLAKCNPGRMSMPMNDQEKLLSKEEVAAMLRIKPRTINAWMSSGRIPYLKVGGRVRFRWSQVSATFAEFPAVYR